QIAFGDSAEVLVEDHDIMPFGPFLAVAIAVLPAFRRCHPDVDHLAAIVERAGLGVGAEIADQNHLVHARHRHTFLRKSQSLASPADLPSQANPSRDRRHSIGTWRPRLMLLITTLVV